MSNHNFNKNLNKTTISGVGSKLEKRDNEREALNKSSLHQSLDIKTDFQNKLIGNQKIERFIGMNNYQSMSNGRNMRF